MCQLKTLFGVILVRVPGTGLLSIVIPLRSPEGLREEALNSEPTKGVGEAHTCAHAAEEGRIHRKMIIDAKVQDHRDAKSAHHCWVMDRDGSS